MNYDDHLIFESNNNVNYESTYYFDENDIDIEFDDDDYINYGSNYPSDISRDDDDYNDYPYYNDNNYHISLLNTTQSFIDTIRNTGGLNKERLLIINGINNELEL
jgi:hypothetical protein